MFSFLIVLTLTMQDAEHLPLKAGTTWSYRMSSGQALEVRVAGSSVVAGQACSILETQLGPQMTREHVAVTREGLTAFKVETASGALEYATPILRAKLPFRKGDAWTVALQEGPLLNQYQYQTDGPERVSVPAGTVEAWKVTTTLRHPQGQAVMTVWYGRGLGMVKQVYELNAQVMTAELTASSLKPEIPPADGPRRCPKCGAVDKAGGKFCAECATPFGGPPPASGTLVRYESKDGKVLLYHPGGWKVQEGEQFGPGTYTVAVEEADESAGILFMTFAMNGTIHDSVSLAGTLLGNLTKSFPGLAVSEMKSGQDRARTTADVTFSMQGKNVRGRFHFFHTPRAATLYGLFAHPEKWEASRPVLARIAANLAYAPEGVSAVLRKGRESADVAPKPQEQNLNPAWILKDAYARAARGDGKEIPLAEAVAQDGSITMAVPRGWTFQGSGLTVSAGSDARYLHGYTSAMYTVFVPGGYVVQTPGMLMSAYLPPAQALDFLLRAARLGADLRILSACSILELDPDFANKAWKPAIAAGGQVDNRLFLAEFSNVKGGGRCRGLFSVTCTAWPLGTAWTCGVDGSWAPVDEFEKWIPVYARMAQSAKQNDAWVQGKFSVQAAESARLNRNLMTSVGELNRSYDRYNQSWWDAQKSKDYTSHAWSQTTLGQGSWVSEREGAQVVRSDSWGLENLQTGERSTAWNQTTFTGRNPWSGEQLNEVDTRAEYEKYIRNR